MRAPRTVWPAEWRVLAYDAPGLPIEQTRRRVCAIAAGIGVTALDSSRSLSCVEDEGEGDLLFCRGEEVIS